MLVELKSVDHLHPLHEAQTLTYLKLLGLPAALLVNFNVLVLKYGLRRLSQGGAPVSSRSRLLSGPR